MLVDCLVNIKVSCSTFTSYDSPKKTIIKRIYMR